MKYERIERDISTLIKVYEKEEINTELIVLLNGLVILVNLTK